MKQKPAYRSRKSEPETVGNAISQMLKAFRIEGKFYETDLVNSWERVMGKAIAKRTDKLYIKNKKLFIHISSAPLKHELSMSRDKILVLLTKEFGQQIVNEVIVK